MDADLSSGPITVLAPSNDAFGAIDEATLMGLLESPEDLSEVRTCPMH